MSSSRGGETAVVSSPVISPPTTDHLRSPTTPPDLDLSSKNVFAFGLPSYGGFSNGDQRMQSFTPLARNGALDQPRGYPWSPTSGLEKSPKQQAKSKSTTHSPAVSTKSVPESSPKPSSSKPKHSETTDEEIKVKDGETTPYYESERSSSRPRSRSESPNVYVGNHSVQDSDHSDPRDGSGDYYDDGQDADPTEDQVHLRPEKSRDLRLHRQGHTESARTDSKPHTQSHDRYSSQGRHRSHGSSTASVSEVRSQPYAPSSHYDRDMGMNMSGSSRIRVDTSGPIHLQSQPQLLLEHTHMMTDMPSPLGTPSSTTASSSDYPYYYPPPSSTTPSGYLPIPTLHPLPLPYSVGMSGGRGVSTAICKFYAQGHCARGEHCNFAHLATTSPKSLPTASRSTGHIHHDGDEFSCPTCRAHKGMPYYPAAQHVKPKERYKQKEVRSRQSKHPKQSRSGTTASGSGDRYPQGVMHPQHMHTVGHHVGPGHTQPQPQPLPMTAYPHPPPMMQSYDPRTTQRTEPASRGDRYGYPAPTHGGLVAHGSGTTSTGTYERERTHGSFDPSGMDFLSKFSANSSIEQLEGNIYIIAKDQYGCRLLQRMLDDQKPKVVDVTFREVFEHINELMTDPFGNYLCQKLIEHCSESQRLAIIQKVSPDLVAISLNMHGTRAVQKLVETIGNPKDVELVVGALRQSVVTLIKDLNGNHVIQRCLHHLSSKDNQFIFDAVARHCVSVATHKHGCCVLQRCIDCATVTQKRQLVQEIVSNALELVQDAFGNYVVQYVLDLGESTISHGIMANLLGSVSSLSVQKFSSNVVEKCLELADDDMRVRLVEELVNVERLPRLLQDPYANYVIQKALQVSKKAQFERLVAVIKPHLAALRNTSFGKRIQSKIMKKFPDLSPTELAHQAHHLSPPPHSLSRSSPPGGTGRSLLPHHTHQSPRSEPHERERDRDRELSAHHSHSSPLLSRVPISHDEKISHSLPVSSLPIVPLTLAVPLSSSEVSTAGDPSSKFQSLSLEETDTAPKVDSGSSTSETSEISRSHDKKEDTVGDGDTAELDSLEPSEDFTSSASSSKLMASKERVLSSHSLLPSSSSPSWLWSQSRDQSSASSAGII